MNLISERAAKLAGFPDLPTCTAQIEQCQLAEQAELALQLCGTILYSHHRNILISFLEVQMPKFFELQVEVVGAELAVRCKDPRNVFERDTSFGMELRLGLGEAVISKLYMIEGQVVRMKVRSDKL